MKFKTIFTEPNECKLWAVCYPEDEINGEATDIFSKRFDELNDTQYVRQFILANKRHLSHPFWNGISDTNAISKIQQEKYEFEVELYSIETKQPGYENSNLNEIFKPLHSNIYSINTKNDSHRKGKPDFTDPMLRIYAIELEDNTFIITGVEIKLTRGMEGKELELQFYNLNRVQEFLKQENIYNKESIIDKEGLN